MPTGRVASGQPERVRAQMRILVRELLAIADQAGFTEEKLIRLEKVLNTIGGTGQFTPKMAKIATAINEIAAAISAAGSPNRVAGINNVRQALFQLAKEAEKSGLQSRRMREIAAIPPSGHYGQLRGAQTRAGMEYRNEQAIQARYMERAAMTFTPQEMEGMSMRDIQDQIGARATSLRLQEDLIHATNEEFLERRKVATEEERALKILERHIDATTQLANKWATAGAPRTPGALKARIESGVPFGSEGGRIESPESTDQQPIGDILKDLRPIIGSDAGVENLRKKMEALGITNARVTSAYHELSNGVRTFGFAIEKDGVIGIQRATVRLDKFGSVMRDVGTRFRTFSSAIGANLIKVVQWGLATGVVYGALNGLRQVLREVTDLENELANVQVALGKGAGDLNQVFKAAAEVADLTSTSIKGVIEGYTLAYQAAGSFEDETMRAVAANSLLEESMILATLSGTNQAQAMDTLVGALRQTGQELTDGRELLDRWVAVSRESNVSLNTLAETYSIVGATAKGLGLSFEELNALTATLAEATGLSATETGNAIRGIVAGFQTAQAENVLDKFGIDTRKATGELRNFWDLLNEVSFLLQSGAISSSELTEIANAIGGGYRRGAQVQTILENMARAQQLVTVQMDAGGEAADALETKMATLSAAIQRLGNAFTNLAQSLGDEGGFLWAAKGIVSVITIFVNLIDSLVGGLGKATPALLAFGAAWLALQAPQLKRLTTKIGNVEAGDRLTDLARRFSPEGTELIQEQLGGIKGVQRGYTRRGAIGTVRRGFQEKLGGGALADPASIAAIIGPAMITAISASRQPEGEQAEGYGKAGIQIAGGIAGALIGGPVGAILGTSIAGAFADAIIDEDREIGGRLAEHFLRAADEGRGADDGDATTANDELIRSLNPFLKASADMISFFVGISEYWGNVRGSGFARAPEQGLESEDILSGLLQGIIGADIVQNLITDEQRAKFQELWDQMIQDGIEKGDISGPFREMVEAGIPEIENTAGTVIQAFIAESQRQFILGDIDVSDIFDISDLSPETIAPALSQLKTALSLAGVDIGANELTEQYLELDTMSKQLLDTASRQVVSQADQLAHFEEGVDKTRKFSKEMYELTKRTTEYNASLEDLAVLQQIVQKRAVLAGVDERPIVDFGKLTPQQIQQVRVEADRVRDETANAYADGSEEGANLWVEALGDVLITAGEGIGKDFIGEFFDQDPAFIKAAIENLGLEDALKDVTQFSLRDLRDQLGVADYPALMRRYGQVKSAITTQFPDYEVKEVDQGLILKDGFRTVHADMTLFNLAMQDLIDVNEQQLEGVWNLPTGMTAFVAWSSLFSRNAPSGGSSTFEPFEDAGGGVPEGGWDQATIDRTKGTISQVQAEMQRIQDLIVATSRQMQDPYADQATYEEGQATLDELVPQYRQLANNVQALTERFLTGGVGGGGVPATQEPVTVEGIVQGFQEAFQLENKIELNASIRLVVDGRTLANVVKQYLFTDLVQATDRSMGGGGGYVIEAE